jgi:Flp pilus assembly CpaF family ATPase
MDLNQRRSRVFVARHGCPELTTTILTGDQVRELVERMLKSSGRRLDISQPFVDAMLPAGIACTSCARASRGASRR